MKKNALILVCMFIVLLSCQENDVRETPSGDIPRDIVNKLEAAGYVTEGLQKFRFHGHDGYLIERDIFLTAEQISALAEPHDHANGRTKHYRMNNLVAGTPRTLSVFMDPAFGSFMQNAFDAALARYNAQGLSLTFQRVTTSSANIRIFAANMGDNGILAITWGGPSGGNPSHDIDVNTHYYNNSTQRPDAITTIAHEIGHAIGFQHTDFMNVNFSCFNGGGNENPPGGQNHIPGTPTGPSAGSWMLACSSNTDRPFTAEDAAALCAVYGHPNEEIVIIRNNRWNGVDANSGSRITVNCVDWSNPEVMSSTGGRIFTVQGGEMWRTDPVTGATQSLGAGWGGSEAMGAAGGYVYTVQGGELWKTNGNNGNTISLGGGWSGTEALAAGEVGGTPYVFAVQGGEFWKTNANSGISVPLGSGWGGTEAMTFGAGYVFAVWGDQLFKIDPSNGNAVVIEGYGWTGTEAMTFHNSYIFAVQGGTLWKTSINGGSGSLGSNWSGTQVMAGVQ